LAATNAWSLAERRWRAVLTHWVQHLGQAGWLARDQQIGGWVYFAGFVIYVAALVLGWRALSASRAQLTASASPG
jgi:hypothetical protein